MSLVALGVNHTTAPVEVRERAAFSAEHLPQALASLQQTAPVQEAVILSTCNRTEIYCHTTAPFGDATRYIQHWLHDFLTTAPETFTPYLFTHTNDQAARHLMRVCSGLDSLVLGEPQILGQVKQAFQNAVANNAVGPQFQRLFQSAFGVAKQVRTETAIGANAVSVAYAAVQMAQQLYETLEGRTALLVGAGETIQLVAKHLANKKLERFIVANRSLERAAAIIDEHPGKAITLSEIPDALHHADLVISSTAAPIAVIGKGAVESALRKRKHQPILFIDIAVPRDIEPEVNTLQDAYVYTVDDLQTIIDAGKKSREIAAEEASRIIDQQCQAYMRWLDGSAARQIVRQYRQHAEDLRQQQMAKALANLHRGQDPKAVLEQLSRSLTNKLIHAPSAAMNRAVSDADPSLLQYAERILGLSQHDT